MLKTSPFLTLSSQFGSCFSSCFPSRGHQRRELATIATNSARRRLQLAAETQQTLGLLVRSSKRRNDPSWSDVQLLVQPQPSGNARRLRVELTCGRTQVGVPVELEIDEVTGQVCEAPIRAKTAAHLIHSPMEPYVPVGTPG